MTLCYPIIDCRFLNSDWREHICCQPPVAMKEDLKSLKDSSRGLLAQHFKKDVEVFFTNREKGYVIAGLLTWADLLASESEYVKDSSGRRLPVLVGISYPKGESWSFPSK